MPTRGSALPPRVSPPADRAHHKYQTSGFIEEGSGLLFVPYRPSEQPTNWKAYLDGAERLYRFHGVEQALDRAAIEDGCYTSLFWLGFDRHGTVVAGIRVNGPVGCLDEVFALRELEAHPALIAVEAQIAERLPLGVLEMKGAWVDAASPQRAPAGDALARCIVHSMEYFGARYAMCTAADHAIRRWGTSGARTMPGLAPVAYPDARYRTLLVWWDRDQLERHAAPEQLERVRAESQQLGAKWGPGRGQHPGSALVGSSRARP
jgi:hypothetical protein